MKKILVKSTGLVLLIVMIFAMAAGPVSAAVTTVDEAIPITIGESQTAGSSETLYSFSVRSAGTLKIVKSGYKDLEFKLYDSEENLDADKPFFEQSYVVNAEVELTAGGTYYISVARLCGFKLEFEANYSNQTAKTPQAIEIEMGESVTVTQERTDGTHQYYSISPDDKSYYKFELLNGNGVDFFNSKCKRLNENTVSDVLTDKPQTIAVNEGKNTLIFGLYGSVSQGAGSVKITRTDFIDIKKISFAKSTYTFSGSGSITLKADLGKDANGKTITKAFESTLTYTVKDSNGKTVKNFVTVDKKNKLKVTVGNNYNAGVYTLSVKTSEGKTASATIKISLTKMSLKTGTTSVGNTTSTTINWTKKANSDLYYIYLLKNGKYVKVGQSTKTSYLVKGLKADSTYSFKITAVKKDKLNGKTVYLESPQSQVWKFITAKSTKPTIKSISCSSCKYKAGSYVKGRYDAGGVWHAGYTSPSHSIATIKVTASSIKGATFYANTGSQLENGLFSITYSGKKTKATTTKVKIRACYSLSAYNSTAFGPWSAEKSVKIPAAK